MADEFVPEADVQEQQQPLQEPDSEADGPDLDPTLNPEVPEADAIEQALPGPLLDDDELRD